jgi:hypothetical protein
MPGPGLITGYLNTLSGRLPGLVVEELADGLEETYGGTCAWAWPPAGRQPRLHRPASR